MSGVAASRDLDPFDRMLLTADGSVSANPENRCATRRCPRSALTVDARGKRSLSHFDSATAAGTAPPAALTSLSI
jgi:hypothetical protein